MRRRIAVIVSCNARRPRTCMCASPHATIGNAVACDNARNASSRAVSSGPRCRCTASHVRSRKLRLQPRGFVDVARIHPRHPQRQQAIERRGLEILAQQTIRALVGTPARRGDQLAQTSIARLRFHQQHALRPAFDLHFAADDQRHARRFGRFECAHDAGERAFVGDRERGIALLLRAIEQLPRARCTALETEVRQAVQFRIGRQSAHANHPCSIRNEGAGPGSTGSPAAQKAQARWPSEVSTT